MYKKAEKSYSSDMERKARASESDTALDTSVAGSEGSCSSESLDAEIQDYKPKASDLSILLPQAPYISDPVLFLDKLYCCKVLTSGDLILAVCGIAKYNDIRGCLTKNCKKSLNSLIEKAESPENVDFFFAPRISNIPPQEIYRLYASISDIAFERCIVISRLYTLEKDEVEEVSETFPEFSKIDIRQFPHNAEEVLFLHAQHRQNTEICGNSARIYLPSRSEFLEFLGRFEKEVQK